jgi:phage terminase small subunit
MTQDQEPGESPSTQPKLTRKQQKFVEEYLVDLNGTQAAIRAGYSADSARNIAAENLAKPYIAAAIDAAMAATPGITRSWVVNELAMIARANMLDYIATQSDGTAYVDLSKLTREQAAAIGEIVTEEYVEGRGDDARPVKRVKFRLSDKQGALEKLGKVLGMFRERHEHTGPGGGPIQTEAIDRPEKETREDWLARRRRELGAVAPLGASTWPAN